MNLKQFIGKDQLRVMREACHGEEGAFFKTMIENLQKQIAAMPKTYETDGQGGAARAHLHYFKGGSDWYIIERDAGSPDDEVKGIQTQAFGFACLNGDSENAELGYISIDELIRHGVELDLYWQPKMLDPSAADKTRHVSRRAHSPAELRRRLSDRGKFR